MSDRHMCENCEYWEDMRCTNKLSGFYGEQTDHYFRCPKYSSRPVQKETENTKKDETGQLTQIKEAAELIAQFDLLSSAAFERLQTIARALAAAKKEIKEIEDA